MDDNSVSLEKIRQSFNVTYGALPVGVVLFDTDSRVVAMNTLAEKISGFTAEELIGKRSIDQKWEIIGSDGQTCSPENVPSIRCFRIGSSLEDTTIGVRRSRETFWIKTNTTLLLDRDNKTPYGAISSFIDITEQKAVEEKLRTSEERYSLATRAGRTGVWDWNLNTGELYIDSSMKETFGFRDDEIDNRIEAVLKHIHTADREAFIELLNDALEDRLREIRTEFRAITKDGASRWLLSHGDIIRNEQGKPVRLLGTFTDITNQKLADDAIHRSQKMDALGQMAGGVAHDFNNVLGVIIGNLNLILRDGSKDEKTLKRLGEIEKSTQRAVELTKKLLGFARQNPEHVAAVNLNTVIDDMRSLVERTVTPKIAVETDLSAQLWPSELDKDDFQDALLNLVLNARDAMPDGGCLRLTTSNARIEESINQTSSVVTPGDYVALKVSDTGTGIAPDDLDRIFEPFFTTKVQGKGTGLGLPMVYSFAKRYGGHIDVESQVDVGTSFALYFPRSERTPAASPADAKSRCILPAGHETVLVVDDELELGELARELLESLGYRVCLAQSGQEALEVIKNNAAIDLLFSDIIMPGGIDGFRLAEEAISHHPNLKILLSSGYAGYALEDNGGDPVSFEFLLKPYSDVELAQRVRKLLDGRDGIESSDVPTHERTRAAPVFQWSEELSTGIDPLDDDHRLLARLLHRSRRMIDDNEPVSTIGALLVEIRDLLVAHCRREEFVMKACGYPKFEEHTESHRFLIYRIDEMREQLDRRELPAKSVFLFLERYLTTHVSKNDLDYKAFCSGKQELVEDALLQAGSNLNPDGLSPDDATIPIR